MRASRKRCPPTCASRSRSRPVIPAADDAFDVVLSWSAFEHIEDPPAVMREIARVLRPDGVFLLQLWPFYHSEHGSHSGSGSPRGSPSSATRDAEIERHIRVGYR